MTLLRHGIDLLLGALVLAVLVVGLATFLVPAVDGRLLAIRSGSMEPSIGVGSLAVAIPADPASLKAGDVVSIELTGGTVLTHRIDAVVEQDDRRMFQLKGDANAAADPVLALPDQLIGRVELTVPWLGYLLAMMSIPVGVAALLSTGGLLITGGWLLDDLAEPDDEEDPRGDWARPEEDPLTVTGALALHHEGGPGRR